jgi:hypothetical protein
MRAYLPTALRGLQRQSAAHPRWLHPWVMVWTMAVAQVISWGTLFYAFSLFVVPMQASLGWVASSAQRRPVARLTQHGGDGVSRWCLD